MSNQVVLTFAGEESGAVRAMDNVGGAARDMDSSVRDSAAGFDRAGEAADGAESRAQGFSDTLTGTADIASGTADIMKGNLFEGFVTVGQGMADLAGGFAEFLIPAMKNATTWLKSTRLATLAKAGADKVAAAAQWVLNAAQLASPTTWIILAIVALIAVIVLIATKTDWFSKAWRASWGWIKSAAANTWDFIKKIPGWIGSAFRTIGNAISAPFRAAFNFVARAWNNTVGRLSWSVPSWIPVIGGNSISVPNLPTFHAGGTVPGVIGTPVPIMAQAGERVGSLASRDGSVIEIRSGGNRVDDLLVEILAGAIARRGGDVQTVLGKGPRRA